MKTFNTTGPCISKKHYMVDISNKLNKVGNLIHRGDYFVINRPRQYGKTTLLSQISKRFNDKYIILRTSFEGMGDKTFESEELFCETFIALLLQTLEFSNENLAKELIAVSKEVETMHQLSITITKFIKKCDMPVVLMIDEVDKASNNQLFLSFLGMLRNKYILANDDLDYTFHSVILAGVHDIKNLKLRLRPNEEKKYNSPWNIAVNFNVDMEFDSDEISTMLREYSKAEEINMNIKLISDRIYFFTSGYPFLVSKLCEIIDSDLKKNWCEKSVDRAVKILLNEKNTLFDSLIKNLENNIEFKEFIEKIILDGEEIIYTPSDLLISLGELYGFIKEVDNKCKLHNKIFEQYIYNHLAAAKIRESKSVSNYNFKDSFTI